MEVSYSSKRWVDFRKVKWIKRTNLGMFYEIRVVLFVNVLFDIFLVTFGEVTFYEKGAKVRPFPEILISPFPSYFALIGQNELSSRPYFQYQLRSRSLGTGAVL